MSIETNTLIGGAGNDTLTATAATAGGDANNNWLNGGIGDDRLAGGAGDDTLIGGDGRDAVDYTRALQGVVVDLAAGTAAGDGTDHLEGIENVRGSAYADALTGDAGGNWLAGGAGDDCSTAVPATTRWPATAATIH